LDEDEDWLDRQDTDHVANIVRVTPWPEGSDRNTAEYVVFLYAVCWARDYGRYLEMPAMQAHNGDVEKAILAFKIVDEHTLSLEWVYTAAHSSNDHSGVWPATGVGYNFGKIVTVTGDQWGIEQMTEGLEFSDGTVKLYVSEDKHAMYPSIAIGESVRLVFVAPSIESAMGLYGWPLPPVLQDQASRNNVFVGEDVGGGPVKQFQCYNAGEPKGHLMDDIGWIFPHERIWSGNLFEHSRFAGGFTPEEPGAGGPGSPGKISDNGLNMPDSLAVVLHPKQGGG